MEKSIETHTHGTQTYAFRCYICICRSASMGRCWNNTNWIHMSSGSVTDALRRIESVTKSRVETPFSHPAVPWYNLSSMCRSFIIADGRRKSVRHWFPLTATSTPKWHTRRVYLQLDNRQKSITFQSSSEERGARKEPHLPLFFFLLLFTFYFRLDWVEHQAVWDISRPSLITRV